MDPVSGGYIQSLSRSAGDEVRYLGRKDSRFYNRLRFAVSARQKTYLEAMAWAKCIVCALLPLESNDKLLVVNLNVKNLYCHEKKTKENTICIVWDPAGHAEYAYWGRDVLRRRNCS